MAAEYTIAAVTAPLAVAALELTVLRTGLFRMARYWITVTISLTFMVPVDGWLTRSDATVVHYDEQQISGVRAPWHIPVEDYGFGLALITLTLLLWLRLRPREANDA